MNKSTENERVIKLIEWLRFSKIITNRRDLASKLGYNESSLSQILNTKSNISRRFIKKLSQINPNINENWILTGNGNMLLNEVSGNNNTAINGNSNNINNSSAIEKTISEISELRKLLQYSIDNNKEQFHRFINIIDKLTEK